MSGNSIVIVLDNWILCCGGHAGTLVLHRCNWPATPSHRSRGSGTTNRVHGSHCSESVNDILCMHISHMYYTSPGNETVGIAVNILKNWRCLLPVY